MKFLLLFIALFLFIDFRGSEEVYSPENLFSQVSPQKYLVLHSLKVQRMTHDFKLNYEDKFFKFSSIFSRYKSFPKDLSYYSFLHCPYYFFEWGPQNLPTPPPFALT
jgi:hypothetical protein